MPKKKKKRKYFQGLFKPNHKEKYVGNTENIVFRSSYEFNFLKKLDESPNVLKYTSETVVIRYYNPVKAHWARYFVDILMECKTEDGKTAKYLVEIKPINQIFPPVQTKAKKMQSYLNEVMDYSQNQAKWRAAKKWCESRGITFTIVTVNEKTKKFEYIDAAKVIVEEKTQIPLWKARL